MGRHKVPDAVWTVKHCNQAPVCSSTAYASDCDGSKSASSAVQCSAVQQRASERANNDAAASLGARRPKPSTYLPPAPPTAPRAHAAAPRRPAPTRRRCTAPGCPPTLAGAPPGCAAQYRQEGRTILLKIEEATPHTEPTVPMDAVSIHWNTLSLHTAPPPPPPPPFCNGIRIDCSRT